MSAIPSMFFLFLLDAASPATKAPASTNAAATSAAKVELRDITGPVVIPSYWPWIALAVGIVLAGLLGWLIWKKYQERNAPKPVPERVLQPHERAWARLTQALHLIHEAEPFCVEVSATLRVYLEERFDLHAPERTTEEFLAELQASPVLDPEQKQTLGHFLQSCDLVKFARLEPTEDELRELHRIAVKLVNETEPRPVRLAMEGQTP